MNQFVLAFPLQIEKKESFKITETVSVTSETKNLIIPGCSVSFSVVWNEKVDALGDLFNEHAPISAEEMSAINGHKSMLFLLGNLKSGTDLQMVNGAILKVLAAGALGVYMQQSGVAWTAARFKENQEDCDFPMNAWLNFLEGEDALYTLGMETFSLPDLCISKSVETDSEDGLQEILNAIADSLFMDEVPAKSGTEVDCGESGIFALRQELKNPFPKDSPEYNRQGIFRLIHK